MLNRTRLILAAIFTLSVISSSSLYGQYYTAGNDPTRVRWRMIRSEHFRMIYPAEIDSLARVYLYTLENIRPRVTASLNIDPTPIPVILHPYTTQSNGVVTWAPKRMDLFTSPDPYSSNPDSWIEHLAIHEYTHVGQVEHFTKGIYNVFYYLLGEQVTGLGLGLFAGEYALEGGAVIAETELTDGGRGRNADFTKYYRVMYLNGDYRNWDRLLFGSHKYYTPDHYVFGYLNGSSSRYLSGIADYAGRYFKTPVEKWYNPAYLIDPDLNVDGTGMMDYFHMSQGIYTEIWRADWLARGQFTESIDLKKKKDRLYSEITGPIYISCPRSPCHGSVIAVKKGMETATKMIRIDSTGREHFIRFFNPVSSRLTYDGNSRIYWSESISNDASSLEDFSVIMYLDVMNGRVRTTGGHRTKYFNPAPSSTGDTLAVAEYPVGGPTFLTLISASDGKVISRTEAPEKGQIRESVFDGEDIYCSVIMDDGIGLFRYSSGEWTEVVAPQSQSISGLRRHGHSLYFSSDLDGVINIYILNPGTGILKRLTNSEYGADYPYIDPAGGKLYYCEYGPDGYRPVSISAGTFRNDSASFSTPYRHPAAEMLSAQSDELLASRGIHDTLDFEDFMDPGKYPSKKYSKLLHAFRIHSWFPVYANVERIRSFNFENFTQAASLGATILSQNSLGDIVSSIAYGYVRDAMTGKWFHSGHVSLNTRIIGNLSAELRFDVNDRNTRTHLYDLTKGQQIIQERLHDPLLSASAMLYYQMDFNSRGWYRSLTPFVSWNFNNDKYFAYLSDSHSDEIQPIAGDPVMRHQLQYGISYGQVIPTATSQIYPRWGFGLSVRGASSLGAGMYFGHLAYADGYVYFPGITRQQGLKLSFTVQKQFVDGKLLYSSLAQLPRGFDSYSFADTYFRVSADYAIPVYLGDFRIGPIFYVKRLQLIPFFDYAADAVPGKGVSGTYCSYGADVLVDFHFIRLGFPISAGIRYARTAVPANGTQDHISMLFNLSF